MLQRIRQQESTEKRIKMFDVTISPNPNLDVFLSACRKVELHYSEAVKEPVIVDPFDNTQIQYYSVGENKVKIFLDEEIGAVYVKGDDFFKELFQEWKENPL